MMTQKQVSNDRFNLSLIALVLVLIAAFCGMHADVLVAYLTAQNEETIAGGATALLALIVFGATLSTPFLGAGPGKALLSRFTLNKIGPDGVEIPRKSRASGAGVKALDGAQDLERKQVRIDPETEEILTAIGGGNLSLGIREAARRLAASKDTAVFEIK